MQRLKYTVSHSEFTGRFKKEPVKQRYYNAKVQKFVEYLDTFEWNFFITGSTGYELTLKSARRLAQRYHSIMPINSVFFWVAEKFEAKDGHHIHGLIKLPCISILTFSDLENYKTTIFNDLVYGWQYATGNRIKKVLNDDSNDKHDDERWDIWNQIDVKPYMKHIGAHGYCAKYINKKKADYDLLI